MSLLSEEELRERAFAACGESMGALVDADLAGTFEEADLEWDPMIRRHVFAQPLVVWRSFDEIEIEVSAEGRIRRFRDLARFADAQFQELVPEEVVRIAMTTGLVGAYAELADAYRGDGEMLVATLLQREPGFAPKIVVTINPTTRQVAALEVPDSDPDSQGAKA